MGILLIIYWLIKKFNELANCIGEYKPSFNVIIVSYIPEYGVNICIFNLLFCKYSLILYNLFGICIFNSLIDSTLL